MRVSIQTERQELVSNSRRTVGGAVLALALGVVPLQALCQEPKGQQRAFKAAREKVMNRGSAPIAFLNELTDWGKSSSEEIFAINGKVDIYSRVSRELGPWNGPRHRRAVMLEVLRVLGGFESSWNWKAGVDVTNPNSNTPCTEEAGIFQCSADSIHFSPSLRALVVRAGGDDNCDNFRRVTKENHVFAMEYCARLLRETVMHHGPVRDRHINSWLRRAAVEEFMSYL